MVAEDAICYRHPDAKAAVGCQRCDRPICAQCMRSASVGFHCPECTKSGAQKTVKIAEFAPQVTYALMAISILMFFAQQAIDGGLGGQLFRDYVLFGPDVQNGEVWRIVTGGFLHGSLLHLGFNMYALYIFGPSLERAIGPLQMLLIYAGGLLGGSAAVLAFNFASPTLGASGAVLGLAGGLAAVLWSRGVNITQTSLGAIFLINLALPLLIGGISFWGHFGGILGGALVGAAVGFLPAKVGQKAPAVIAGAATAVVALGAAAVGIGFAGGLA